MKTKSEGLVGKFCHRYYEDGFLEHFPKHRYVKNQGQILSVISRDNWGTPTAYEVQWFSWLHGYPTESEIVLAEQMLFERWNFYSDEESWRLAGDQSVQLGHRNADKIKIEREKDEK